MCEPECDVIYSFTKWHIHINIVINGKTILSVFLLICNTTRNKATLKPEVAIKNSDVTNLTCHFKRG